MSPPQFVLCFLYMHRRGAIVYTDITSGSHSSSKLLLVSIFIAGVACFWALLEIATEMDPDSRVLDPPLQPVVSSDDDDIHGAPPTPWGGVVLNLLTNLTLKQMLLQFLHLDVAVPGLVRVLSHSTSIDLNTSIDGLEWPRQIFIQISSFTEYQRCLLHFAQLQHAPVLTPPQQTAQSTLPTRVHVHFISVFRSLQQYENLISTQSVVIARLEHRLARLERCLSTGEPLVLTPRPQPDRSVWYPDSDVSHAAPSP